MHVASTQGRGEEGRGENTSSVMKQVEFSEPFSSHSRVIYIASPMTSAHLDVYYTELVMNPVTMEMLFFVFFF